MQSNTTPADCLRAWARHMGNIRMTTPATREAIIEDYDVPRAEAERIVDEEWAAAEAAAAPAATPNEEAWKARVFRVGDRGELTPEAMAAFYTEAYNTEVSPATLARGMAGGMERQRLATHTVAPVFPVSPDGLAAALAVAGWRLRFNTTCETVECCGPDGHDEWAECSGVRRALMFEEIAKVARRESMGGSAGTLPWRVGHRLEERLLLCVAAKNQTEAAGTLAHEAVLDWAAGRRTGCFTLAEIIERTGILQKFESAARVPKNVQRDAARALKAAGWVNKSVRLPVGCRPRWVGPDGRDKAQTVGKLLKG